MLYWQRMRNTVRRGHPPLAKAGRDLRRRRRGSRKDPLGKVRTLVRASVAAVGSQLALAREAPRRLVHTTCLRGTPGTAFIEPHAEPALRVTDNPAGKDLIEYGVPEAVTSTPAPYYGGGGQGCKAQRLGAVLQSWERGHSHISASGPESGNQRALLRRSARSRNNRWARPWRWSRGWRRTFFARWSAQHAFIVLTEQSSQS